MLNLAFWLVCLSNGQTGASELDNLMREGVQAYSVSDYPKALLQWQKGLELARKSADRRMTGNFLAKVGGVYINLGQYEKALGHLEEALGVHRELGDKLGEAPILGNISVVYYRLGQYEKGLNYLRMMNQARLGNGEREAAAPDQDVSIHSDAKSYDEMMDYCARTLAKQRDAASVTDDGKAVVDECMEYLKGFMDPSRLAKDFEYMEQAFATLRQYDPQMLQGLDLGNLRDNFTSLFLSLRQQEKTHEYLLLDLDLISEIQLQMSDKTSPEESSPGTEDIAKLERAMEYGKRVLPMFRQNGDRNGESMVLGWMGRICSLNNQDEKALSFFDQSLAISRETGYRTNEGATLTGIGMAYWHQGKNDKARHVLGESLKISLETGSPEDVWRLQVALALTEARLRSYDQAIGYFEYALDTIESMRTELTEKEAKHSFMIDKFIIYDAIIELLQRLHSQNPSKGYDRRALEIFERKQGRIFLEEIGKSGARNYADLPDAIRARELFFESELDRLSSDLRKEYSEPESRRDFARIRSQEDAIRNLKTTQQELRREIMATYPDYYALRYPKPTSVSELQERVLRSDELMLVYGVRERTTSLWLISNEAFDSFTINVNDKALAQKVEDFRNALSVIFRFIQQGTKDGESHRIFFRRILDSAKASVKQLSQSGQELYCLMTPEKARSYLSKARVLYIIPTGPLYGLPFETLVEKDEKGPEYLVKNHSIAYLSSASLLKTLRDAAKRRKSNPRYPLLAFANPVYERTIVLKNTDKDTKDTGFGEDERSKDLSPTMGMRTRAYLDTMGGYFPELPDTEDEALRIKAILEASEESHPLQLREAASRANVLELNAASRLDDYRYLLFACHGILPNELDNVMQPALVLSHPDPKTRQEGFLTMADVFGLKLNADLVSLSACNTARGKEQKGEGVMSLTRAFMYAGAPSISVTLWSVESVSMKTLSSGLYRGLKDGKGRAEALSEIKTRMIRGEEGELYQHPFFWAPVIMFGEAR